MIALKEITDDVLFDTPDGAYCWNGMEKSPHYIQVIVIGPMVFSPADYRIAVEKKYGCEFDFGSQAFLDPGFDLSPEKSVAVRSRGFASLIFKRKLFKAAA